LRRRRRLASDDARRRQRRPGEDRESGRRCRCRGVDSEQHTELECAPDQGGSLEPAVGALNHGGLWSRAVRAGERMHDAGGVAIASRRAAARPRYRTPASRWRACLSSTSHSCSHFPLGSTPLVVLARAPNGSCGRSRNPSYGTTGAAVHRHGGAERREHDGDRESRCWTSATRARPCETCRS
jgi:hypothetical protein